ncbi:MAG: hypothetical protein ABJP45_02555 [Cyclobacteriaceae bacterium]
MAVILTIVVGGFLFFLSKAMRKDKDSDA